MKKILLILSLLISSIGIAQDSDNYKQAASSFQNHYNNGDVVGLFNMFDDDFKKVSTLEKTKTFFKNEVNMSALGKIKAMEYINTFKEGNNYIVNFENGVYNLYIKVGTDNKLEFFKMNSVN
ncbi:hypothetical protein [Psychroserpens sp. NJDZ02]|uniref:hypothetical protein n=1 Tax=Psychroserpens sp. NJDZ02 TaxID=2570561 RepID=UPI0010A7DB0C|nr:hypothetical protein [Psychroserpens sp. NJDZ02]QCE40776.1 hypothetical protein E9099_04865 [Psychroserpens sp. NJDZ02]